MTEENSYWADTDFEGLPIRVRHSVQVGEVWMHEEPAGGMRASVYTFDGPVQHVDLPAMHGITIGVAATEDMLVLIGAVEEEQTLVVSQDGAVVSVVVSPSVPLGSITGFSARASIADGVLHYLHEPTGDLVQIELASGRAQITPTEVIARQGTLFLGPGPSVIANRALHRVGGGWVLDGWQLTQNGATTDLVWTEGYPDLSPQGVTAQNQVFFSAWREGAWLVGSTTGRHFDISDACFEGNRRLGHVVSDGWLLSWRDDEDGYRYFTRTRPR